MDQVDGNRAGDGKHLPRSPSSVLEKLALEEAEALEVLRLSDHGDEPEEPRAEEAGEASRENPPATEENVSAASPSLPAPPRPLRSQLPAYAHRQGGGSPAGAGHGQGDWHPHQNGPVSPVYFVPQFDAYGPEAPLGSPGAPAITQCKACALPACTGVGARPGGRRWHRLRAPVQRAHLPPALGGAEIFSNWRPRGMPAPGSPAAGPPSLAADLPAGCRGARGPIPDVHLGSTALARMPVLDSRVPELAIHDAQAWLRTRTPGTTAARSRCTPAVRWGRRCKARPARRALAVCRPARRAARTSTAWRRQCHSCLVRCPPAARCPAHTCCSPAR